MLEVQNLVKKFKDVAAVDSISFNAEPGKIFGLLGPNGAGKTTIIRSILNILTADSGSILLNGRPIDKTFFNRIGYLPEERGLYKKSTVADIILYFAVLKNIDRKTAASEAQKWLSRLDIKNLAYKKIEELSKGNQQKVQFITAVLHNPELLVLDEPFSGFDPINQQEIKEIIQQLISEGKIIILSTHMMDTAEKLCSDILLMNKGKEVLKGSLSDIKKQFSANTIMLAYEGDEHFLINMPQVKNAVKMNGLTEIELNENVLPKDFLITASQNLNVTHFSIHEPGLEEIFIHVIKENSRQ